MEVGSRIPDIPVQQLVDGEVRQINLAEFSAGRTVVLVAVPGAFTPTCSDDHVPGYFSRLEDFRNAGVDEVVVVATSDFFVVKAWSDQLDPPQHMHFMADGSQTFAGAVDQLLDLSGFGLGMRTQRYAAIIRDGSVVSFAIEPDAAAVTVTGAEAVLASL